MSDESQQSNLLGIDEEHPGLTNKGLGRPTGSTNIASRRASKKLEELGFDPIAEMVALHRKLTADIYKIQYDEDGLPREKFSALALSNLMSAQQRCVSELLRYGYARATESTEVIAQQLAPVTIRLSSTPEAFDTSITGVDRDDTYKGEEE
jgi:hypothetical protein